MATQTVSSNHPSATQVVEKKVCEEVKTIEEVVSPPKETEQKTPPSTEDVSKTYEEKPRIVEPEEKFEEKPKEEDASEATVTQVKPEEKPKAEDSTTAPAEIEEKPKVEDSMASPAQTEEKAKVEDFTATPVEPEEKVEDKNADDCQDKGEIIRDVSEQVGGSVDIKEEEEVKEPLPEKETEAGAEKDAGTSEVEHTKEVTPEVVISEENSTGPPAITEEFEKDSNDTVAKVQVEDKVEVVELSNEKAKDVVEETEELIQLTKKEVETLEDETTKNATEEVDTTRDINSLTQNGCVKDEKVSDIENRMEEEAVADATEASASLGELLKPQTEEKEQEKVEADSEKERTIEETTPLGDVIKSDISIKDVDTTKETSKDTPVEDVPVTKSKQSNNILTKVKQSLVKAKKAIIGKSPSSKTPSSETKAEIKA